jgi:antibiotic biosynthesis monooxygenase (ABM) superfamily enzyme
MKESKRSSSPSKEVTEVISRNIIPNHEKDYDDWLERFMRSERQFPGYLGTTIIAPEGNTSSSSSSVRYIINRFKDQASLDAWENSEEAIKLLEEVNNYTTRHYERATGLETWFSLPRLKGEFVPPPPPRWKMAIVSFIGAYCISSVAQHILSLYLGQMPLLINLLMTVILVLGLTYFAMPLLSRLFRRWLYPETK